MSRKVIFIGPAYPYRGGIAAFNENLATIFQTNGWECKIYTFIQQYPNMLFPGKNQLTTEDPKPNLTITRGIYSTNPLNWLKISKQIVNEKPDLVITQYWMPFMAPAFGTILRGIKKGLPNIKCCTVVHNFKPHESRIGDKQLNKFIVNRTDLMIALSDTVAADITAANPDKNVVKLFHPIYDHYGDKIEQAVAKKELGWDPDTCYLLFFGLIRRYKGVDMLMEALAKVKMDRPLKLYIAGEIYEVEKKYTSLIEKLNLEDKIILRNAYIPNEDVPKLFCAADAIVLPYRSATQSGVVPIALHFERPILVTRVGGLSEIIEHHGVGHVCDSDIDSLAAQLQAYLDNQIELKSDFGPIKSELSWQEFYNQFIAQLSDDAA